VAAFAKLLQVGERKAEVAVGLGWQRVILGGAEEDGERANGGGQGGIVRS